ncbi:hypothetical protein GF325_09885 [Candidatus Bathyarchaeota archaeon]|nr:hypothetical protein [Candidatus Bathyarchaeota archaeon]
MDTQYSPHESWTRAKIDEMKACSCGGKKIVKRQSLHFINLLPVKEFILACDACGDTVTLLFDTSAYMCKC